MRYFQVGTVPLSAGYRRVPLFSKSGANLEPSSLFIYVWYYRE